MWVMTYGDTDLHLEPLLHGRHALEVPDAGLDVLLDALLCNSKSVSRRIGGNSRIHLVQAYQRDRSCEKRRGERRWP